eukprot:15930430-Heterocapsa_arctica.AAC.1
MGRREEPDWITWQGALKKVPEQECWDNQGKPYAMKWIDAKKPDGRVRCCLVVREIKKAKREEDKLEPQD